MLSLLLTVLILGVIAWGVSQLPIHPMFLTVAYCIIAIYLLIILFKALGVATPSLSLG